MTTTLPSFALRLLCIASTVHGFNDELLPSLPVARRRFVATVVAQPLVSVAAVGIGIGRRTEPAFAVEKERPRSSNSDHALYQVYQVMPDATESLNPSLDIVDPVSFRKLISPKQGGALWLGEHHNSMNDHVIQARLIRDLHGERRKNGSKVAVGLEQVQVKFQPVLDEFVAGKLSLDELKLQVEWDKRWSWPFEIYRELFVSSQELGIPLIALNVNSEDLALVEQGGLPALPRQTLLNYIADPAGFAEFASTLPYREYVDYVIRPSYDLHLALGLLNNKMNGERLDQQMSFRNFLSGRILWDETMANRAFAWTRENPRGLLVGLVGADHVKFGKGIPGRYARMVGASGSASISVLLNPTLVDSRPPGSVLSDKGAVTSSHPDLITLQLRYLREGIDGDNSKEETVLPSSTGGVLPLADYLIVG